MDRGGPPRGAVALALVPSSEGRATGGDQTLCALASDDIETDRATLEAKGVDVDPRVARTGTQRSGLMSEDASIEDPMPPQCFFRDPDGNRFLIVEPG